MEADGTGGSLNKNLGPIYKTKRAAADLVQVELDELTDGQKKFRGFIRKAEENVIELETDQGIVDLPFEAIYKAKLVMTDHLIKETKKRFETANENDTKAVEEELEKTTTI